LLVLFIVPLIVPLIDPQQTFRYGLILFAPSSYHEDVISIIAVIGESEDRTRPTASASYVTANCKPSPI
jgi:hypothetical protein